MASRSVIERLTAAWNAEWPETPPIAFLLRSLHPDRWVRFHSLPGSKRYPETDAERTTVLRRHHALMAALGRSSEYFVVWTRFASDPSPDVTTPDELHWQTMEPNDYFDEPAHVYVSAIAYPSAKFDEVLQAAADCQLADVIIGPHDLGWLYHPYDGGADVIAPSPSRRDELRAEFAAWLSAHPEGL